MSIIYLRRYSYFQKRSMLVRYYDFLITGPFIFEFRQKENTHLSFSIIRRNLKNIEILS